MKCAVTIGNFDGVHLGHQALIHRARELAGSDGRVIAMTFDPHPTATLRPEKAPTRLTTFAQRSKRLQEAGASEVIKLEPTPELLNLEPDVFIHQVVQQHKPTWFVEGPDFHFGHRASGTPKTLEILGKAFGFEVVIEPPVEVELLDQSLVRASSTLTRWLLSHGRVADAARVLGRPYTLAGTVMQGDQRGRTINVPTANLDTQCMPPADGVYAAFATLPDGRSLPAAVNVGTRPTFAGVDRRIEAHVIGTRLDGLEYGWPLELEFISFLRDQVKFDSIDTLRAQLQKDCDRAMNLLSSRGRLVHT